MALYVDDERAHAYDACGRYAYDRKYIRKLMEQHCLKRWQENGILFGYTNYSSTYMGFDWFFADVISRSHVPYNYTTLQIQALFNQLALHHFNRMIENATKEIIVTPNSSIFRKLRERFITFTNLDWFHDLTPQIQGKEIYSRQSKALNLAKTYDLIKDKMQQADDYLASVKAEKMTKEDLETSKQGVIATAIGGIVAFVALAGVKVFQDTLWNPATEFINKAPYFNLSNEWGAIIYSAIIATVGYKIFKKRINK